MVCAVSADVIGVLLTPRFCRYLVIFGEVQCEFPFLLSAPLLAVILRVLTDVDIMTERSFQIVSFLVASTKIFRICI